MARRRVPGIAPDGPASGAASRGWDAAAGAPDPAPILAPRGAGRPSAGYRAPVRRLPALAIGLVLAAIGVLAWMLWDRSRGPGGDGVELVDVREDVEALLAERGPVEAGEGLVRVPLDEETALRFFPTLKNHRDVYDPQTYFRNASDYTAPRTFREHPEGSWTIRYNRAGFKSDRELRETPPDLRVLVAGDSHSEGVVPTPENYCSRFEALYTDAHPERTVEVLNASRGGYSLYNYLGALEKYAHLGPRVFVMGVFGGNDFAEVVPLYAYFNGESLEDGREGWGMRVAKSKRAKRGAGQALSQGIHQEALFHHSEVFRELARRAVPAIASEAHRVCEEHGIQFVLLYIPPAPDVQLRDCEEGVEAVLAEFDMTAEDRGWTERIADELIAAMRAEGALVVDLRPAFRAAEEPLYWKADLHINIAGHALVARELYAALEAAGIE